MTVDIQSLRIVELNPDDVQAAEASYQINKVVRAHDQPDLPPPSRHRHFQILRLGWPGHLEKHWLGYDGDRAVGELSVDLPQRDNLENAWIELRVIPEYRRRGIGRALYAHAVEYVRAAGRTHLMADTLEPLDGGPRVDPAGSAFATAMGLTRALREVRRKLYLSTVDHAALDALLAAAWTRADGYSLVQWTDRCPDDCVADVAYLEGRLNTDAPMEDLAWGKEDVDADLIRHVERNREIMKTRAFFTAVRHDASGRVVALTAMIIEHGVPEHAWQGITLVDPPHRGHRLGTIVKIENLRLILAAEPALTAIDTGNAAVNDHMIAINHAMGFQPMDAMVDWQVDL
jgi:GNAT superfamily N-acetyltransferase